jgi:hypothetical protein
MTLMEVLIAVSLAALLAGGLAGSLGQGVRTMEMSDRRIAAARRNAGVQRLLEQQVAGFMPAIVRCGIAAGQPGGEYGFFDGRPNVTRFVTSYSLEGAARGGPRIVEWFFAPGESGQGQRLLLNEWPYAGPPSAGALCTPPVRDAFSGIELLGFQTPSPRQGTFVLADKLQSGSLSYLEAAKRDRPARWVNLWVLRNEWPAAIRLESHTLPDQATAFSPVTFTGRIHVDMPPGEPFAPK